MEREYISQAEFARRVGSSKQRINILVKEGRLPTNERKKIPYIEGAAIWETCRDIQYTPQALIGRAKKGHHPTTSITAEEAIMDQQQLAREIMEPEPPEPSDDGDENEDEEAPASERTDLNIRLSRAKVQKEEALARMKELELLALKKKYIPVEEVNRDASEFGAAMRKRLLAIPKRVSTVCEGRSAVEIEIEVEKEINDILKEFKEKRF